MEVPVWVLWAAGVVGVVLVGFVLVGVVAINLLSHIAKAVIRHRT